MKRKCDDVPCYPQNDDCCISSFLPVIQTVQQPANQSELKLGVIQSPAHRRWGEGEKLDENSTVVGSMHPLAAAVYFMYEAVEVLSTYWPKSLGTAVAADLSHIPK